MVDRLNRTRKHNLEEARSNLNEIDGPRLKAECETGVSVIFQHERKGWPTSGGKSGVPPRCFRAATAQLEHAIIIGGEQPRTSDRIN